MRIYVLSWSDKFEHTLLVMKDDKVLLQTEAYLKNLGKKIEALSEKYNTKDIFVHTDKKIDEQVRFSLSKQLAENYSLYNIQYEVSE
ncbi:MAG: hypothetical protein BWY33_01779 [Candidatus Dependentiae bacterium ADurb.Bin246]|nr:MAG: hypothetical protein BWY33_01779 [Candidatus Dependentiae bacterium ADurb.Bin246]